MVSFREMVETRKGKKNEGKAGESLSFRADLRRERERMTAMGRERKEIKNKKICKEVLF